jgi:hypothetical protein
LCWDIEPPTAEQADSLLAQARVDGREVAVRALLKKIKMTPVLNQDFPALTAKSSISESAVPASTPEKRVRSARPNGLKLFLVVMSLLVISVLSVAIFHVTSQGANKDPINWKFLLSGKASTAEALAGASNASASQATLPIVTASAALAAASNASGSVPVVPETVASSKPIEPIEVIISPPPEAIKAKVPEPLKEVVSAEASSELVVGQSWVKKMPRGTFLVQHTAVPTIQEAYLWIQRHPVLKSARVVVTYLPSQKAPQYAVVSGPFGSLLEATGFVENGGIPKDPMIRSARFMKEQFTPELADADAKKRKENRR